MSAVHDPLVILAAEPLRIMAQYHNLILVARRRPPTVDEMAAMRLQSELLARKFPQGFVVLQVSYIGRDRAAIPSELDRQAMVDFLRVATDKLLLLAIVVPMGGFALATVRSVLLGIKMQLGARSRYAIYGDLKEAADHAIQTAQPHTPATLHVEEVLALFTRLESKLAPDT